MNIYIYMDLFIYYLFIYSWPIERFVQDLRFYNGFYNFIIGLILTLR